MIVDTVIHCRRRAMTLLAAMALCAPGAHATTPQEATIFKAAAPHQQYPGGPKVAVHRARLHGTWGPGQSSADVKADYQKQVQACVQGHEGSGMPLNPPTTWPDAAAPTRFDIYLALNRTIRYSSGTAFLVNQNDCSLISKIVASATLTSSHGSCNIDLVEKTASGWCDAGGQASAPFEKKRPLPTKEALDAHLKQLAADPRMAPVLAATQKLAAANAPTGAHKVILGIGCDVWPFPGGGTMCMAPGGSFKPGQTAGDSDYGGLLLEMRANPGHTLDAVEAQLDDSVGGAVFTPYLAPGFKVTNTGPGW